MRHEVAARAPARIDLGGGWTDVPPYCDREGGFVCNVAIDRRSTARIRSAGADSIDAQSDVPLVRAALKRSGATGVSLTLANDFPTGAGLGGSSAASAAILAALREWTDQPWERAELAEDGRRIEVEELGIAGGRQDHYAATHGGALALTFTSIVDVRRLVIPPPARANLLERCCLVYTGQSRISGETITAVLGAYERGDAAVVQALARMRELAQAMAAALERGDVDAVGSAVGEHWQFQRRLHPSIPTPLIDDIIAKGIAAGALGAKAMGASGGGCVLLIARDGRADAVRSAVRPLGEILEFGIDEVGVTILRET